MSKAITEPARLLTAPKPYEFGFTLGADPEFTFTSGTRPMAARDIMMAFFKDTRPNNDGGSGNQGGWDFKGGNIGWDGHNATGEVRPKPGSPEQVVANLKNLFEETQKRLPFVDLTTLTMAGSTGGHIHLSIPQGEVTAHMVNSTDRGRAIERALASFMVLIMLGENEFSRELRRRQGHYGDLLDYRYEPKFRHPNGENGYTIEVRSPSAEWITTEKIALGTLAYAAIAWDSIINNRLAPLAGLIFKSEQQVHTSLAPLLANYANVQRLYLNRIRPFVRQHPAYRQYKDALELVLNPERAKQAKKDAHFAVAEGWGLTRDARRIKTKEFMNEEIVEKGSEAFPESVIRNVSQFAWNDDLNVEAFATALSKRCIALGWKPKHEYYLFGMKRGFNSVLIRDETGAFVMGHETIKTKDDLRAFEEKFGRLENRVKPAYTRFVHPKTGELVKDGELKRVMVGIPHAIRKKNDVRSVIRAILRFEKNPKAFPALDPSSLPEGKGEVREALTREEEIEHGVEEAKRNADKPRELREEQVAAVEEERESAALERGEPVTRTAIAETDLLSSDSVNLMMMAIEELEARVAGARNVLTGVRDFMNQHNPQCSTPCRSLIEGALMSLMENDRGMTVPLAARAYLIMSGAASLGGAGVEASTSIYHQVRMVGSTIALYTPSRSRFNLALPDNTICDLFGVNINREGFIAGIRSRPGTTTVRHSEGDISPAVEPGTYISSLTNRSLMVNPDNRLAPLWVH